MLLQCDHEIGVSGEVNWNNYNGKLRLAPKFRQIDVSGTLQNDNNMTWAGYDKGCLVPTDLSTDSVYGS